MDRPLRRAARWAALATCVVVIPTACGSSEDTPGSGRPGGSGGSNASGGSSSTGGSDTGGSTSGSGGSDTGGAPGSGGAGSGGDAAGGAGGSDQGTGGSPETGGSTGTGGSAGGGPWAGLHVMGTDIVDASGQPIILRGLGPGEWFNMESYFLDVDTPDIGGMGQTKFRNLLVAAMGQADADKFFATWEANVITAEDVAKWASWGVNSIRLPINYHSVSSANGTYIEEGFKKIDAFVALCKPAHIYVILDLHAAPGAQNNEQMSDSMDGKAHLWTEASNYQPWTIDLWKTIAARYANETAVGGYNIFDEPLDVSASGLRAFYVKVTEAIRSVDAHHILYIDGLNWSSDPGFDGLGPAWDPEIVWSFHKYWDTNNLASIQPYLDLRESTERPVWNGETGESDTGDGWYTDMIKLCEDNKIGWNMWTYKKLGSDTQPYSIKAPANWAKMKAYLQGGAKPSQSEATTIMMELAANAATNKCTLNSSYMKAVFNK
jgi:endoglucanase